MKKLIIQVSVLLIVGHLLTELSSVLSIWMPEIMSRKVNLFIKDGYPMEYWWYFKFAADDFLWVITFFVLCKIAYVYSFRLFLICGVFLLYHVADAFMFWYNFKQSHWGYWGLLISIILCILFLILPIKKESKYKSLI